MSEKKQELWHGIPLSPWHKFEFMFFIHWLVLKNKIKDFPLNWINFILEMERQIKLHDMLFFEYKLSEHIVGTASSLHDDEQLGGSWMEHDGTRRYDE